MAERKLFRGNSAFICNLSRTEADRLVARGQIRRDSRNRYTLIEAVQASKSEPSPASLTGGSRRRADGGDMHTLAGRHFADARLTQHEEERLAGWGLIPSTV